MSPHELMNSCFRVKTATRWWTPNLGYLMVCNGAFFCCLRIRPTEARGFPNMAYAKSLLYRQVRPLLNPWHSSLSL